MAPIHLPTQPPTQYTAKMTRGEALQYFSAHPHCVIWLHILLYPPLRYRSSSFFFFFVFAALLWPSAPRDHLCMRRRERRLLAMAPNDGSQRSTALGNKGSEAVTFKRGLSNTSLSDVRHTCNQTVNKRKMRG